MVCLRNSPSTGSVQTPRVHGVRKAHTVLRLCLTNNDAIGDGRGFECLEMLETGHWSKSEGCSHPRGAEKHDVRGMFDESRGN